MPAAITQWFNHNPVVSAARAGGVRLRKRRGRVLTGRPVQPWRDPDNRATLDLNAVAVYLGPYRRPGATPAERAIAQAIDTFGPPGVNSGEIAGTLVEHSHPFDHDPQFDARAGFTIAARMLDAIEATFDGTPEDERPADEIYDAIQTALQLIRHSLNHNIAPPGESIPGNRQPLTLDQNLIAHGLGPSSTTPNIGYQLFGILAQSARNWANGTWTDPWFLHSARWLQHSAEYRETMDLVELCARDLRAQAEQWVDRPTTGFGALTPYERALLKELVADGSISRARDRLQRATRTGHELVDAALVSLLHKLGVAHPNQAVLLALNEGQTSVVVNFDRLGQGGTETNDGERDRLIRSFAEGLSHREVARRHGLSPLAFRALAGNWVDGVRALLQRGALTGQDLVRNVEQRVEQVPNSERYLTYDESADLFSWATTSRPARENSVLPQVRERLDIPNRLYALLWLHQQGRTEPDLDSRNAFIWKTMEREDLTYFLTHGQVPRRLLQRSRLFGGPFTDEEKRELRYREALAWLCSGETAEEVDRRLGPDSNADLVARRVIESLLEHPLSRKDPRDYDL